MDLRKLRHAVALADEGSFARAARRLNLTQPALSRSIQALEAGLRLALFDRGAGGVRPTADGRRIIAQARTMLQLEVGLQREARLLASGDAGRVVLGVGPMLVPLLGDVLEAPFVAASGLELRVEIEAVQRLAELLSAEVIDFFIADTRHAAQFPAFSVTALASVPAGYYVRAGHPLAGRAGLTLADLAPYPLASPELGRQPTGGVYAGRGGIACEDVTTLKRLTLASDAVLLAIGFALEPELAQGQLVPLSALASDDGLAHVGVVEPAGRTRSAAAERVIAGFFERLQPFAR